jgi:hypothetical protein
LATTTLNGRGSANSSISRLETPGIRAKTDRSRPRGRLRSLSHDCGGQSMSYARRVVLLLPPRP